VTLGRNQLHKKYDETSVCSGEGCDRRAIGRGMCKMHYSRWRRRNPGPLPNPKRVHGRSQNDLTYKAWMLMRRKCYGVGADSWRTVGARGIKVCDRWEGIDGFEKFLEDMGERPAFHILVRLDLEKDFYKENCKWVPRRHRSAYWVPHENNKSGFTGVHWDNDKSKWAATISHMGHKFYLGYFDDITEAIGARLTAENNRDDFKRM
jgi:hypothetical protein